MLVTNAIHSTRCALGFVAPELKNVVFSITLEIDGGGT
jgi:hypothetical protein